MSTKMTIVLAAALVLGTASEALARSGAGGVRPCSLAGVNPVLHGAIFGKKHPDVAKVYGFVKLSGEGKRGTWGLDPSVCGHTLGSISGSSLLLEARVSVARPAHKKKAPATRAGA